MFVSLLQEHLLPSTLFVAKNVSTKTQLPITQHVLLYAGKGILNLATTTVETTTVSGVSAKTDKEGGICVPSRLFLDFVSSLPQGKVDLEAKEGSLLITSQGYKATLPGMDKAEFPPIPVMKKEHATVQSKAFDSAVKSVLFAAATDEGRPLLTGVKIKKTEEGTLFVATDGYRLSLKRTDIPFKETFDAVIPAKALGHILQIGQSETLGFGETEDGQLGFIAGENGVYTRAIEGEYPPFDRIIPKSSTTTATLEREPLLKAVKTAAIFAKDNANIVKFRFEDGNLLVSANTPQVGESSVSMGVTLDGDGGEIAFNSRFLIDFLNNVQADNLTFEMTGSLNPGVFKIHGDDSFLHIIMPVRLQTAS